MFLSEKLEKSFPNASSSQSEKKVVIVSPLPAFTMQKNTSTQANCNVQI